MNLLLKQEAIKSKKQLAYEAIKEEIINNRIKPGTILVERQLCEALNTSRTPIREALQKLTNEGLVDFNPGKGAFVSDITYLDLIEIYHIREVLEGLAASMCAKNIDAFQVKALEENLASQHQAVVSGDSERFIQKDMEFHDIIVEIAGNKRLKLFISNMRDQIKRITYLIRDDKHRLDDSLEQHNQIFKALKAKDLKQAENAMKSHMKNSIEYHIDQLNVYRNIT